jgi:4-diphosphocytidyl-2-C-methyl-D-erythritol kinase
VEPGHSVTPSRVGREPALPPLRTSIDLEAPAKLNLGLRVVGVRADGYHLLESLFVPLDLHDDVRLDLAEAKPGDGSVGLELRPEIEAETHPPSPSDDVPTDARNLAVKAAMLFLEAADLAARVRITMCKRIPSAAGLGGGSSDAGAVLRGLDAAWPGRVPRPELEALALRLGADVPFFLEPRPALVAGIGERRSPVADLPELAMVLANPRRPLSTAEVFADWDEKGRPTPAGELAAAADRVGASGWGAAVAAADWAALLQNDLAAPAERLCPAMRPLRARLEAAGAHAIAQSGSGATVFGLFSDVAAARRACESLSVNDSAWFRVAISLDAR